MKTILLQSLHEKCMEYLRMIEHAENDKVYYSQELVRHDMTNFRNELKLWPLGEPDRRISEQKIVTLNKILDRVENRYFALLLKINTHALKTAESPTTTEPAY